MAMLAEPEMNHLDMDEFINFSVTNESPARPIIMRMNAAAAAAAASMNTKEEPASPFGSAEFNMNDLSAPNNDWLNAMGGLESVLSVSTPSSRGSSLETPGLPQNGFVSIDPTRLKEIPSAPGSEMSSRSPAWSLPDLQPSSYEQPSSFPTSTSQQSTDAPSENNALVIARPPMQRASSESDGTMVIGKRKRRQSALPDLYIPAMNQQPQARGLQRSMSTGTPIIITHLDTSDATLNQVGLFSLPSPVTANAPMSAPAGAQNGMPFSPCPPAPSTGAPLLAPQPTTNGGHQRTFSYSGLATIPEAPSSAPPDASWTNVSGGPPQVRYGNTDITTYTVPPPPATPSLPSNSAAPSPMIAQEPLPFNPSQAMTIAEPLRRPNSCPSGSIAMGGRLGYTFQLQQQEAQRQYLQPHVQQLQVHHHGLSSPQLGGDPMSAHAHFSPLPNCSPQLPDGQFPPHPGQLSTGPMSHGPMSAGPFSTVPLSAGPISAGPLSAVVGMGRPVLQHSSSHGHTRRSSDSELAFAMGQPNVGAMLRSTSVPQTIIEPTPIYATGLPPPPSVSGYAPMTFVPYEPNALGFGRPRDCASPPRKRVASKRVGTCLKPGPKGKPKPKAEGEMTLTLNTNVGSLDDEVLHSIHDDIPTNLMPVSFEEFQASFTITPSGTIIPMLGIEAMTERLMYATAEPVVDACFRWCYQIGSEFNHAAEKQSKFFRCCFDECVGTNSRIFMRKSAVDSHVRTHIGFRPFRCEADPECDARFVRKHDRDRHVATTHRNEKSFLCTDCGQNFARSDALLRHRAKRDACKARTGQL